MATGTVTFSAATYAPGSPGPDRAILTITRWAGLTPPEGARDRYETITAGADLVVELEESTDEFCYRVVVSTPATLGDEVRFVTVPAGASNYETLTDVDPMTFEAVPPDGSARAIFATKATEGVAAAALAAAAAAVPNTPEGRQALAESAELTGAIGSVVEDALAGLDGGGTDAAETQALLNVIPRPAMASPPTRFGGYSYGASSATVTAGGSGYVVGELITLAGGTPVQAGYGMVLRVATLSGSAVATVTVAVRGAYTTTPTNAIAQASTTGAGTGATFNVASWVRAAAGTPLDNVWVQPTDVRFRFTGMGPTNQSASGYYGNGTYNYVSCSWEWATDSTIIDIRLIGLNTSFALYVDGERVDIAGLTTNASGQEYLYTMNFGGVARVRNFRLYGVNSAFGGVRISGTATLTAPTTTQRPLAWALGDSYALGTGADTPGTTALAVMCEALGLDLVANGVGSTGWNSATTLVPATRIANTLAGLTRAPTYIIFDLGYNDAGGNMTTAATAFDNAYAAAIAAYPSAKIIVMGPATPQGATANLDAVRTMLQARAAAHSLPFIDVRDWVNMTNEAVYTGSDNIHPSPLGHKVIGARKAAAVRAAGIVP